MRIKLDRVADSAFILLGDEIPPGGAPRSVMCDLDVEQGAVILLLSPEDRLVGLEILGASRVLPSEVLAQTA
ncbi:MAG: DUF2283 domain-containing protein [Candidatus Dormibacteria bacterium]|jgi:uncharacterized protein YuzE